MADKRLEELVKIYTKDGVEAAFDVLKGLTANELGVLRFDLVCLTQLVDEAEPAEELDDEEE
jgi:hypothetical protein